MSVADMEPDEGPDELPMEDDNEHEPVRALDIVGCVRLVAMVSMVDCYGHLFELRHELADQSYRITDLATMAEYDVPGLPAAYERIARLINRKEQER